MAPLTRSQHQDIDLRHYEFTYPNLSLHSAAANSNLGLVKYALSNGQPANSVLNGVLPIHAAAAGGHEDVVRMLIESGASIDAPRLPRKYMTDKTRNGNFTLGTAGSTPLHFAAANGHIGVIELLLACGARPDKVEKLGKTPEQLATEQGHVEAAELLSTAARNFHEGALGGPGTDEEDAASVTSRSKTSSGKGKAVAHPHAGLSNRLGSSPSSASLLSIATTQSAFAPSGRRLAAGKSSESLASQIKDKVGRTASMKRKALPQHHSERLMKHSSEMGTPSMPRGVRRPSLPSVFDKGLHPGQSLRSKLGMTSANASTSSLARPPPLNLNASESDLAMTRQRQGSGSSRSLASVFTRQTGGPLSPRDDDDNTTIGSPSVFSPISEDGDFQLPGRIASSDTDAGMMTPLALPQQPLTAPAANHSFFPDGARAETTASLSHSTSDGNINVSSYRPRKQSNLSSNALGSMHRSESDRSRHVPAPEDDETDTTQKTESLAHRRTNSNASNKAKGFFGRFSRANSASRTSFSDRERPQTSPPVEQQPQLALPQDEAWSENESADAHPSEAGDHVGSEVMSLARITGRPRGDSIGSTSSGSASRSYAPSPLAGASSDHLHPADGSERPLARTRQSRSGSTATDPDLRQAVLSNTILASSSANASVLSGSPGSASSIEPLSSAHSAHSTAPSSAIWSSASPRSPKGKAPAGPPRTPTGDVITPAQASSMVRKAEQQLLSFDVSGASDTSSRLSLSEQLAAYGESLAVERQAKRAALQKDLRTAGSTAAPMPYSWEKLGKDGTRTPVSRSERVGTQLSGPASYRAPGMAFQQGPLDRRRSPAPTLRQEARLHSGEVLHEQSHHVGSSLRYEALHTPRAEHKHDPIHAPSIAEKTKDHSPESTLLSPPKVALEPRRRSVDRRSKTPETGSANSSQVEPPRSRSPHALLAAPSGSKLRPVRSRPQELREQADELELQRSNSIMSMKDATPIAPLTIESKGGGRVKRLINALKGAQM